MKRVDGFETPRLVLRRWRDGDREPFAAMNADPEVMRHFRAPLSPAESDAFVDRIEESFASRGYGLWAVEVRDGGAFVGFTGLWPMPDDGPAAGGVEIGWRLARPAWGHGYATEAAEGVVEVAFDALALPELWSQTATGNERSQAVMRRLGMTFHAAFDHPLFPPDHPARPQVVYHLGRAGAPLSGLGRADGG